MFQKPHERLPLSFVFQDKKQGVGADTYFNCLGRILGKSCFKTSARLSDYLGIHAEGLENRLMVILNEVEFKDVNDQQSLIKDLVSCEETTVNPKNIRPSQVDIFCKVNFSCKSHLLCLIRRGADASESASSPLNQRLMSLLDQGRVCMFGLRSLYFWSLADPFCHPHLQECVSCFVVSV